MGQRGVRSRRRDEIIQAASALLANGPAALKDLGLTQSAIAEHLGVGKGSVGYYFGAQARTERGSLVDELLEKFRNDLIEEVKRNAADYRRSARDIEGGARAAGRALFRSALLADLTDYQTDE